MRIYILTQNAPVYLGEFLDKFLKKIKKEHVIEGIVLSSPLTKKSILKEIIQRFYFYGFLSFIKMSTYIFINKIRSYLFYLNPNKNCISASNVIKKYNLIEHKENNLNSQKFIDHLKSIKIDLIISIASPIIFREPLLKAPRFGCINYHTGLLPKYRGRQPLFWAMLKNEKYFGISIHIMDKIIDNGPILVQAKVPILVNDSLHDLYLKSIKIGPQLLSKGILNITVKNFATILNDIKFKTQYSFPQQKDTKKFRSLNKKFF